MSTSQSNIVLDIDYVRRQFPALTDGCYKDVAFFENAGGTYIPRQVLENLDCFMIDSKVQPYAPYAMSQQASHSIERATIGMAEMINSKPSEISIGHCSTMNLYILSMAMLGWLSAGDEIIVTNQDHEANISPWQRLKNHGVIIKEWCLHPDTGDLEVDDLNTLLTDRTRLVCMPHSSNIIGSVNDVKNIADKVHEYAALLLVDGVSYAPHHAIDVEELGVDFYVLSLYKIFGPHLGLIYVNERHHDKLKNQSLEYMPDLYSKMTQPGAPNYMRIALNPGYVNHEEAASLLGLIDYFRDLYEYHFKNQISAISECVKAVFTLIEKHESALAEQFLQDLCNQNCLELIGQKQFATGVRAPTYSFRSVGDKSVSDIAVMLSKQGIAVQSGCFYAWRCLRALGIDPDDGVLRVSMAHFNTSAEVERLNSAIISINT